MIAMVSQKDFQFILESFDWKSYPSVTVVDVGGGCGTINEGLALRLPGLKFIVQDSEDVFRHFMVASDVKDRVSIMPHDFFQEQPVQGAETYHFRNIFHSWLDNNCISILGNLVSAPKTAAHIIMDDFGSEEAPKLPAYRERQQW